MALGTALAILGGGAALGSAIKKAGNAGEVDVNNQFLQNPEYKESQGARELWWKRLQEWGNDPNYGAISPDWSNIWENVQKKVNQYYEGSATAPGVKDRIKSSLARRGMSESPASDMALLRSDVERGNTLSDVATQQGITQAQLGEEGRINWLRSLQDLESRKPTGQWQTTITDPNAKENAYLDLIGGVGSAVSQYGIGMNGGGDAKGILSKVLNRESMAFPGANTPWGATQQGFNAGLNRSLTPVRFSAGGY